MSWLGITGKMLAGVIVANLVVLAVAVFGYSNISEISVMLNQTSGTETVAIQQMTNAKSAGSLYRAVLSDSVATSDPATAQSDATTAAEYEQEVRDSLFEYKRVDFHEEDKLNVEKLITSWEEYTKQGKIITDLSIQGKRYEAEAVLLNAEPKFKEVMVKIDIILRQENDDLILIVKNTEQVIDGIRFRFLLFVSVIAIASSAFGIWMARTTSRPLSRMALVAEQIAEGKLSSEVEILERNDEIGVLSRAFSLMVYNLNRVVHEIAGNSQRITVSARDLDASIQQITTSAEYIADSIQLVAKGSENQVRSVADVTSAVSQMSSGLQQIASNSEQLSLFVEEASKFTDYGRYSINKATNQMEAINASVNNSAEVIGRLEEKLLAIGNIIDIIRSIADQTNLLSLNAAIEAARAGEHGRGFVVVADEVRKLAEQSTLASKEIAALILSVKDEAAKAVETMDLGKKEVALGSVVMGEAGNAFTDIHHSIDQVFSQIRAVSEAVQEMASGSELIVEAVEIISGIAKDASSMTISAAASAEEQTFSLERIRHSINTLSKMSRDLDSLVVKFRVTE